MARGPNYLICGPGPFDTPEVLWDFLRRLRKLDQEDIAVQMAREDAVRSLAWKTPPWSEPRSDVP